MADVIEEIKAAQKGEQTKVDQGEEVPTVPQSDSPQMTVENPQAVNESKVNGQEGKTYQFSNEEMAFLQPRQVALDHYRIIYHDVDTVMIDYVIRTVCKRIGINPVGHEIRYDVYNGTLTVTPKKAVPKVETV